MFSPVWTTFADTQSDRSVCGEGGGACGAEPPRLHLTQPDFPTGQMASARCSFWKTLHGSLPIAQLLNLRVHARNDAERSPRWWRQLFDGATVVLRIWVDGDNVVLRCAIDAARHSHCPLYVVFIDLKNAFPSTDHSALSLKLFKLGAGGPRFDFMRALYIRMQCLIRPDSAFSVPFMSGHGIMAGDSASPMFWLLFMADLLFPNDANDIILDGVLVSHSCQPSGAWR